MKGAVGKKNAGVWGRRSDGLAELRQTESPLGRPPQKIPRLPCSLVPSPQLFYFRSLPPALPLPRGFTPFSPHHAHTNGESPATGGPPAGGAGRSAPPRPRPRPRDGRLRSCLPPSEALAGRRRSRFWPRWPAHDTPSSTRRLAGRGRRQPPPRRGRFKGSPAFSRGCGARPPTRPRPPRPPQAAGRGTPKPRAGRWGGAEGTSGVGGARAALACFR